MKYNQLSQALDTKTSLHDEPKWIPASLCFCQLSCCPKAANRETILSTSISSSVHQRTLEILPSKHITPQSQSKHPFLFFPSWPNTAALTWIAESGFFSDLPDFTCVNLGHIMPSSALLKSSTGSFTSCNIKAKVLQRYMVLHNQCFFSYSLCSNCFLSNNHGHTCQQAFSWRVPCLQSSFITYELSLLLVFRYMLPLQEYLCWPFFSTLQLGFLGYSQHWNLFRLFGVFFYPNYHFLRI